MDEKRFRDLMRGAIGEEAMSPWLADAVRTRVVNAPTRVSERRWLILVAAALIALVVGALEGPHLLLQRALPIVPAATPSSVASPTPIDAFDCRLPVAVGGQVGFISTSTGVYAADPSAPAGARSYSPAARRWLLVGPRALSPDGQSYARLDVAGSVSHLHVIAITSGVDREVWQHSGSGALVAWAQGGLYLLLNPTPQSPTGLWLVNPASGSGAQQAGNRGLPFKPLPSDPDPGGFTTLGLDSNGHWLIWFYNLDRSGAVDAVFYEIAPGQRVYIYRGTMGDSTGFVPGEVEPDSTGIWFATHDPAPYLWHWSEPTGLRKVSVSGAPAGQEIIAAGPCF
jgi:hypothetical protein